jgi:hypothetical protein
MHSAQLQSTHKAWCLHLSVTGPSPLPSVSAWLPPPLVTLRPPCPSTDMLAAWRLKWPLSYWSVTGLPCNRLCCRSRLSICRSDPWDWATRRAGKPGGQDLDTILGDKESVFCFFVREFIFNQAQQTHQTGRSKNRPELCSSSRPAMSCPCKIRY